MSNPWAVLILSAIDVVLVANVIRLMVQGW